MATPSVVTGWTPVLPQRVIRVVRTPSDLMSAFLHNMECKIDGHVGYVRAVEVESCGMADGQFVHFNVTMLYSENPPSPGAMVKFYVKLRPTWIEWHS